MPFCDTNHLLQSQQQLTAYLSQPRVATQSTNIYQYWKCSQFPLLEVAAKKYLSSPPTSVASEWLFSSAGQVYANRRSKLKAKMLFLAYNIHLFDFHYWLENRKYFLKFVACIIVTVDCSRSGSGSHWPIFVMYHMTQDRKRHAKTMSYRTWQRIGKG